jgi:hypothetical protein
MRVHPDPRFGIGAIPIRGITLRFPNARSPGDKLFSKGPCLRLDYPLTARYRRSLASIKRGTEGSNLSSSSGESRANLSLAGIRLSRSRSRGFPRVSGPGRAVRSAETRRARQHRADGPYSGTAPPVMRSATMPRGSQRSRAFFGLNVR